MSDADPAAAGLTIEDVLRSPALQLRLLAGRAGLARTVSWAHVSELDDPTPWLLGAELIMTTGIAVPRPARAQVAYVERLDDAGVAGLAVSAHLKAPPLHPGMLRAADDRGLPLLEVPLSVPFVAIAQEVAATSLAGGGSRLGAQLQVFGALRWVTEEDLDSAEIIDRLGRLSGYSLYLCTPQGGPLLPGVPVPDLDLTPLPAPDAQAAPSVPGGFVIPVPAPGGPAGYLVARARDGARPGGLAVVQHIATVAALQLTMVRHERETLRRVGAETLAELLADVPDPAAARRRLQRAGLTSPYLRLALVVGLDGEPDDGALARDLDDAGVAHLVLRQQDVTVVLCPAGPGSAAVLDTLAGARCGSSSAFAAGESLEVPRREARWALARAVDTRREHVSYADDDTAGRWLPEDAAGLRALADRVLGTALAYDADHTSDLVGSVRVWLLHDRRLDRSAQALHIHANTLAYRLRRFCEVSGLDLDSTADLAEVWLAVRALRHVDDGAPRPAVRTRRRAADSP